MIRYSRGKLEESNRVIRHYVNDVHIFTRLIFVTDFDEKGFYCGKMDHLLGHIHSVMQFGIWLGDRQFQFLSYSSSELKSHGSWFLCQNDPYSQVTQAQIESTMGDFSLERNLLKK